MSTELQKHAPGAVHSIDDAIHILQEARAKVMLESWNGDPNRKIAWFILCSAIVHLIGRGHVSRVEMLNFKEEPCPKS